jgi:hypothetical protein
MCLHVCYYQGWDDEEVSGISETLDFGIKVKRVPKNSAVK